MEGDCLEGPQGQIGKWDVSSITDMTQLFSSQTFFYGDLSKWDVSSVKDMSSMFQGAQSFNGDISKWDVSSVVEIPAMFRLAASFRGGISRWDVSRVVNMDYMFWYAVSFKQKLRGAAWVRSKASKNDMFRGSSGSIARAITLITASTTITAGFSSKAKLKDAVEACLKLSPDGDCSNSPHGPIAEWHVSSVTDMNNLFTYAKDFDGDLSKWDVSNVRDMTGMFMSATSFNGDLSKWDVSSVTTMEIMFAYATSFDRDISKWDVSSVTNMNSMFRNTKSFKQKLCGAAWLSSTARKKDMFEGSPGSISQTVCTSSQHVSRQPLPDRELIVRTPIAKSVSTPAITSTIAERITCPKCGTFQKSGRNSCCAPGGAWFKNCGGDQNKNVDHTWFEGVAACKRKFETNDILYRYIFIQATQ